MHDTQITTVSELEQTNMVGVEVEEVELVVVSCGDSISVFEGYCPHQGTLLAEGQVENGRLVCHGHGWQFNCTDGVKSDDSAICLHKFSTKIDGDKVLVDRAEIASWLAERRESIRMQQNRPIIRPEQLPGPKKLPILGNLHQIKLDKIHLILEDWHQQYGDLYQFTLANRRAVAVADPNMVQEILRERPDNFSRLSDIRETIEEMGVEGLFSAEGEQWRRHRNFAAYAFDMRHLREFFPTMSKVTQRLHDRWQKMATKPSPIDVQKELMRYTVDITTNLAFGYDMNTLEEEGGLIQQHLERIFPMLAFRAFMPIPYWRYFKLPADWKLEASLAELRVAIDKFIANAREELAANPTLQEHPRNLLQALISAQVDENTQLSDHEIYGNVFTFLLAGEDTTANTIAWMIYFMAKYPEVQKQMQAEADAILQETSSVNEYEFTSKLQYIEAVAHETMRFKPVATFLGLQALNDVQIEQLQIPRGMKVFVLLRPKALDDTEFADAAEFKPERWLNYSQQDNPHHRKSFSPFGGGPRLCPGRSLALLEIKMALSMICRHFDVLLAEPNREIEERFAFTVMPQDLMISLRPREH